MEVQQQNNNSAQQQVGNSSATTSKGLTKEEKFLKITFLFLGLSQLVGWNAVLSTFHFFAKQFSPDVFHLFNIPLQVGQFLAGISIHYLAQKFTIIHRIGGTLGCLAVVMISMPIIAVAIPNNTGMYICTGLVFFLGILNATAENSMVGIAGQEGGKLNNLLWVGNAVCGLSMSTLTIILNLIFMGVEDSVTISAFMFFAFSGIIIFVTIYLVRKYALLRGIETVEKQQSAKIEYKTARQSSQQDLEEPSTNNNQGVGSVALENTSSQGSQVFPASERQLSQEELKDQTKITLSDYLVKMKLAFKHAGLIPLFVMLIYVVTFIVFPKMMLFQVQFTSEFLNKNGQLWGTLLLLQTFQVGDVMGNWLGGFKSLQKKSIQYTNVILRLAFIGTALGVSNRKGALFSSQWFPFVNMFLMAITNGCATSALMELGPRSGKGKKDIIETIQFISAFFLMLGILFGSFLAVPFDPAVEIEYFFDESDE